MTLEQYFGESYRYIWSDNWCLDDDRVWFIAGAINILFCLDLNKKETIVVDKIPSDGFRQHPKCMKKGNHVICIPDNGMDIWCYHIPDSSWLRIPVETPGKIRVSCYHFWLFLNKLYIVSKGLKKILEVDINLARVINYYNISSDAEKYLSESVLVDDCIYTVSSFPVSIYKFNCRNKQIERYELLEINDKIQTLCFDGEKFWLTGFQKRIYIWREDTKKIEIIKDLPEDLGVWNFSGKYKHLINYTLDTLDIPLFYASVSIGDFVWLIPFQSNRILFVNKNTYVVKDFFLEEEEQTENDVKTQLLGHKYLLEGVIDNRYIILFSLKNKCIVEIDTQKFSYTYLDYTLDFESKSKIYKIILSNYYKRKNVILESEIFAINELIKQLVQQENKSEDKNKNTLYGNSIYIKMQRDI